MTVIAVFNDGDEHWICSDADSYYGNTIVRSIQRKARYFEEGKILMGHVGEAVFGQRLAYEIGKSDAIDGDSDYLGLLDFVESLRCNTSGILDGKVEGLTMISVKSGIYLISADGGLHQVAGDFWAIGQGQEYALGYMEAMRDELAGGMADAVIRSAVECAGKYSTHCCGVSEAVGCFFTDRIKGSPIEKVGKALKRRNEIVGGGCLTQDLARLKTNDRY